MTDTPTLLIVDDDIALRSAFARALERVGYRVITATGSPDLVDLIVDERPGAILMDNHMPDASGVDLITLIRRTWPLDQLPIVLISGSSIQGEIDEAMQAGANDFRRKPVDLADLISTVNALFDSAIAERPTEQGATA